EGSVRRADGRCRNDVVAAGTGREAAVSLPVARPTCASVGVDLARDAAVPDGVTAAEAGGGAMRVGDAREARAGGHGTVTTGEGALGERARGVLAEEPRKQADRLGGPPRLLRAHRRREQVVLDRQRRRRRRSGRRFAGGTRRLGRRGRRWWGNGAVSGGRRRW